ncbi:MAG TPA: FISUMP domain-containing protein, partial [Ohtaekwangia sp.]|nr:FISUMP domain-containing protein [Ohtaekwangia sp.]
NIYPVTKMLDGKDWIAASMNVERPGSLCYDDLKTNCDRYGRLYTWEIAQTVCGALGDGWRLPTRAEWQALAKHYGGIYGDSNDEGKAAFIALTDKGSSQFNALLSGGSDLNGGYKRIDAHGFYWTSTEATDSTAWFANLGKGRPALYLQNDGEKALAFAVRCARDR